jgi:hypothetical protein
MDKLSKVLTGLAFIGIGVIIYTSFKKSKEGKAINATIKKNNNKK